MKIKNEFNVGDKVRVVSKPFEDCPFTWTEVMNKYCGATTQITWKEYNTPFNEMCYYIEADGGRFMWCGNCFTLVSKQNAEGTPYFKITDDDFAKLLNMT